MISVEKVLGSAALVFVPAPGRRRLGAPPGGPWDRASFGLACLLAESESAWELALVGAGQSAVLRSQGRIKLAVTGGEGRLHSPSGSASIPAVAWLKEGEAAEVEPLGGHRFWASASACGPGGSGLRGTPLAPVDSGKVLVVADAAPGLPKRAAVMLDSGRMGIRLEGGGPGPAAMAHSEPSSLGVLQWTPQGVLIVHGPDGPTTGGYSHAGWISAAGCAALAQAAPGAWVELVQGSQEDAARQAEKWKVDQIRARDHVFLMRSRGLV